MVDFKIFVKDEAASKEAQELLFQLGYKWRGGTGANYLKLQDNFMYITAYSCDMRLGQGEKGDADKEITLLELRDLVVLKRKETMNIKEYLNEKYELITSKEELSNLIKVPEGAEIAYIYGDNTYFAKPGNNGEGVLMWVLGEDTQWDTTGWNSWQSLINTGLELIWQRNKAKEFLDPEDGYSLVTAVHALPNWIEVPDGAMVYLYSKGHGTFFKECLDEFFHNNEKKWKLTKRDKNDIVKSEILWHRNPGPVLKSKEHRLVRDINEFYRQQENELSENLTSNIEKKLDGIPVKDEAENNTTYQVQRQTYLSLEGDAANNTMNDSDFMNLIGQILGNKFTDIQKTLINLALNK